jgi:hypothetical protein
MMSRQRTDFRSWQEELAHRQRVEKKLAKYRGLQDLLAEWERNAVDTDAYREHIRQLKERIRQARNQFTNMKP